MSAPLQNWAAEEGVACPKRFWSFLFIIPVLFYQFWTQHSLLVWLNADLVHVPPFHVRVSKAKLDDSLHKEIHERYF